MFLLVLPTTLFAGAARESEPVSITWLNYSDHPLVPAGECRIAATLERKLNIDLTLQGGPQGSEAISQQLYLAMLRGQELADVFPWHHTTISSYPPIQDLYAPITIEQVRRHMPNTYAALQEAAMRTYAGSADLWADVTVDGKIYAIPRLSTEYSYTSGILWRRDILDEVGMPVPETVEEWERVFEAYVRKHPGKTCWGGIDGHGYVFETIFRANDRYTGGYTRSGKQIVPAMLLPEFRETLEVLRRWTERGYIQVFPQRDADNHSVPDTDRYFVAGDIIVTDNAGCTRGDLICDPPYYPHSLPDKTSRQNPGATFVLGPYPRFASVPSKRSYASTGEPYVSGFFGFNRRLAGEPERLERIMEVVDTILGDEASYLLTQFGIEGSDWRWEMVGGERRPVRTDLADLSANLGRYWLQGYSRFERRYGVDPRITQSAYDSYTRKGAIYGAPASGGADPTPSGEAEYVSFRIPYNDRSEQAEKDKSDYQRYHQGLHELFYRSYYLPILEGRLPIDALEEFKTRYYGEGGRELAEIIQRWSRQ
ncbi:MAG: hypothetical protein JXB46_06185 [Candidatus Eisenbacteria bacterium]|nr:hypothetical protein [Candidatus Eisenbacteria bacterium]